MMLKWNSPYWNNSTVLVILNLEPDWFAAFDEQKAVKDAVHKLKVCSSVDCTESA